MKKLLLILLGGVISTLNVLAADYTFGIGRTLSSTTLSSNNTTGEIVMGTTPTGVSLTLTSTNDCFGNSTNLLHNNDKVSYTATKSVRNCLGSGDNPANGAYLDGLYFAFKVVVPATKRMTIKQFYTDIYAQDKTTHLKYQVYVNGTRIYESADQNLGKPTASSTASQKTLDVSSVNELKGLTGTIEVRMPWYLDSKAAYVAVKDFNITASFEDVQVNQYTVTAVPNNVEYGSVGIKVDGNDVNSGDEVVENKTAVLTATPTVGYKFTKWVNSSSEVVSTDNPYNASVTSNLNLTAIFETATTYTATFAAGESEKSNIPAAVVVYDGNYYTLPIKNQSFYQEGYTVTGWNVNDVAKDFGEKVFVTGDMTITPNFTANTKSIGDRATTVTWDFQTQNGCIPFSAQYNTKYLVSQATIGTETIDVLLTIDATNGKFDNTYYQDWAQVNSGTILSIPSVPGTVVKALSMGEPKSAEEVKSTLDDNEYTSYASNIATYSTENESGTSSLTIQGGSWYRTFVVEYPAYIAPEVAAQLGQYVVRKGGNGTTSNGVWTSNDGYVTVAGTNMTEQSAYAPYGEHYKLSGDYTITVPRGYIVKSVEVIGNRNKNTEGENSATVKYFKKEGNNDVQDGATATLKDFGSVLEESDIQSACHIYASHPGNSFKINVNGEARAYILINRCNTISAFAGDEYSTFYAPGATLLPDGLEAYTGSFDGSTLTLNKIVDSNADGKVVIPAQTAVVLRKVGAKTAFDLVAGENADAIVGTNDLKGVAHATAKSSITGGTICVLGYVNSVAGFYKFTGTNLGANKAYLVVPSTPGAKGISIVFDDEEATAINGVAEAAPVAVKKFFKNGQLLIQTAKGIVNAVGVQVK